MGGISTAVVSLGCDGRRALDCLGGSMSLEWLSIDDCLGSTAIRNLSLVKGDMHTVRYSRVVLIELEVYHENVNFHARALNDPSSFPLSYSVPEKIELRPGTTINSIPFATI